MRLRDQPNRPRAQGADHELGTLVTMFRPIKMVVGVPCLHRNWNDEPISRSTALSRNTCLLELAEGVEGDENAGLSENAWCIC